MDEQSAPPPTERHPRQDPWAPPKDATARRRGPWRGRIRTTSRVGGRLLLGTATVLIAVMLFNATNGFGTQSSSTPSTSATGTGPAASAAAARRSAEAFFTAWQHNDLERAAQLTDDPSDARSTLSNYRTALNLRSLAFSIQRVTAQGTVLYSITAGVALSEAQAAAATGSSAPTGTTLTASWTYDDFFTSYPVDGVWLIKWDPRLVAPNLTATETLALRPVPPGAEHAVDTAGNDLSRSTDPGLRSIAAALASHAPHGQATPGIEVELMAPGSTPLPETADVIRQPSSTPTTTIDPKAQAAAETAVHLAPASAMVVIQPSTGHILAVANNDGADDLALTARIAPGPAGEIITSAALLGQGMVTLPGQSVGCPARLTVGGDTLTNEGGASEPAGTPLATDFAASCGNAFAQWYDRIGSTTLAQTAVKDFGLNQPWNIGLGTTATYYTMPTTATGAELARELAGQGKIEASPLALASIAATIESGTFDQPTVTADQSRSAATPLPAAAKKSLWQLMDATTTPTGATVHGLYTSVHSTVYAQAGAAQADTERSTNSWAVAFDPALDLAVGTLVLGGTSGSAAAGPATASLFQAMQ